MATTPYTLETTQLGATAGQVLLCPANQYLTTKKVTVTNTTTNPVTITVYKVASGGTPSSSNLLVNGLTIPGSGTNGGVKEIYEVENQTLLAGDSLYAMAGTAAVLNLNVSGILQTT